MADQFDPGDYGGARGDRHDSLRFAPPSYRPQRHASGVDPDLKRMALMAGGIGVVLVAVIGGWQLLGEPGRAVPVIEAPAGPIRVKPDNPGGMQVVGAEEQELAPGADQSAALAPPPETPALAALRAEQQAAVAAGDVARSKPGLAAGPSSGANPPGQTVQATAPAPASEAAANPTRANAPYANATPRNSSGSTSSAPISSGSISSDPGLTGPDRSLPGGAAAAAADWGAAVHALPAPGRSPSAHGTAAAAARPRAALQAPTPLTPVTPAPPPRPTPLAETALAEPTHRAALPPPTPLMPDAAAASGGAQPAVEVQLAALDSAAAAEGEWQRLSRTMPDLLGGRRPNMVRADRDGRVIYRLRLGGFSDFAAAASFCQQVRARGGGCAIAGF